MMHGLIDANLDGNVHKKRVCLPGRGKSGGTRTIIGTNRRDNGFFVFESQKNEPGDIDDSELAALREVVDALLAMSLAILDRAIDAGEFVEIHREEKPRTQ
jgi:hypothetical protein